MARLSISRGVLNALFARSGNLCAFPGCTHELVTRENLFVAEVCHIEAAAPGGERYNSAQTDEERRGLENLLILCHKHHVETDNVKEFSVERMKEIKLTHEAKNGRKIFKIDESLLYKIQIDMQLYWSHMEKIKEQEHFAHDMRVQFDILSSPIALLDELRTQIGELEAYTNTLAENDCHLNDGIIRFLKKCGYDTKKYEEVPYFENPFYDHEWGIHNLGICNTLLKLRAVVLQVEIYLLSEFLKTNATDEQSWSRLDKSKKELEVFARDQCIVD